MTQSYQTTSQWHDSIKLISFLFGLLFTFSTWTSILVLYLDFYILFFSFYISFLLVLLVSILILDSILFRFTLSWSNFWFLKILPKNSSKKNSPKKFLPKKFLQKKSYKKIPQKKSKKFPKKSRKKPKNFQTISQKVPNFENIQFPTSHLEAENPFGLVFSLSYSSWL